MNREARVAQDSASAKAALVSLTSSIQSRLDALRWIRDSMGKPLDDPLDPAVSSGDTTPMSEAETAVGEDAIWSGLAPDERTAVPKRDFQNIYPTPPPSRGSGVDWRYGRQGIELVASAREDYKEGLDQSSAGPFERTAYIDGVSYLLKGLPRDLDEDEVILLRKAISNPLTKPTRSSGDTRNRPITHRATQFFVSHAVVWISALLPYVYCIFQYVMHLERKYKVRESILALNIELANTVAAHLMHVTKVATSAFSQTIQNMASGVADGVEDGCSRLEA